MLEIIANDDWQILGEIAHYGVAGCCHGSVGPAKRRKLVKALVWALFGQMLKLWQRSRRTDAELTINWVGLGIAFHGALIEIIPVWVDCMAKKRRPTAVDFAVRPAAAAQQEVAEAPQPADAPEQAVALVANGQLDPSAFQKFNEKFRTSAVEWAASPKFCLT